MAKQSEWDITVSSFKTDNGDTLYTVLVVRKQDGQALSYSYLASDERLEGKTQAKATDKAIELAREEIKGLKLEDRGKVQHRGSIKV